jgi:hypothetical protein
LFATAFNLSKNDITSKRKAGKFITQAEKAFYMNYTEEQHNNSVINFLIYIVRKGCVYIDNPKDVSYNRDLIIKCQTENIDNYLKLDHIETDPKKITDYMLDPMAIMELKKTAPSSISNRSS